MDGRKGGGAVASKGQVPSLHDAPADQTVEEYLQAHCNNLVQDLNAHTEELIQDLNKELAKGKAEILALARGEHVHRPMYTITLVVKEGPYSEGKFTLMQTPTKAEFIIGRSTGKKVKESGVSLPQDPEVSTVHAKVECRDGRVCFEDLGSTNGSFVNGQSIEERSPQVLSNGDLVKVGSTVLEVHLLDHAAKQEDNRSSNTSPSAVEEGN